jgi:hypothetical protein
VRIAQPCALTTRVLQTSENCAPASVVTSIGSVVEILELRRGANGGFPVCIAAPQRKV